MGAAKKLLEKKVLRNLVPLNALSAVHLEEISKKAVIEEVRSGRYVFRKGDRDYQSVYLIEGKVELLENGREVVGTLQAGSEPAQHPLAHKQPRQLSVRAVGNVTVARIDSSLLDVLLTWDESCGYDVVEIDAEENEDWMTRMLQSEAFLQLPPSNIHQLLMRLEEVTLNAGDTVVQQGDEGDYFYIVKTGRLAVSRKASPRGKDVLLAELGEGACFGEEALVAEATRNASVTMLTDGTLMRLSKDDFKQLLCAPMVHEVQFAEARDLVSQGALWLDVRLPGEYENQSIRGSINLPLSALRDQSAELDKEVAYVVCCDTGRRSAAGAFLLRQLGFSVYTLKNGLMDVPEDVLHGEGGAGSGAEQGKDAEIIPFGADDKGEMVGPGTQKRGPAAPHPSSREQRSDADHAVVLALQEQLRKARQQLQAMQLRLQETEAQRAEEEAISARVIEQIETLEGDLQRARKERSEFEQQLRRLQADSQSSGVELEQVTENLERERGEYEKRTRLLEQELAQIRDDYKQLGQRAGSLAGDRDAVASELAKAREDLAALQQKVAVQQQEASSQTDVLTRELEVRARELETQKDRLQILEGKLVDLAEERDRHNQALTAAQQREQDLEEKLQEAEQRVQAALETARDEASVAEQALNQRIAELESELASQQDQLRGEQSQRESLADKLGAAEQALTEAQQREQDLQQQLQGTEQRVQAALETARGEAAAAEQALHERIAELESELASQQDQLRGEQSQREVLADKLGGAEQALTEAQQREQGLQEQLQEAQRIADGYQQELGRAGEKAEELTSEFERVRRKEEESAKRVAELEKQLTEQAKDYKSEIAGVRDALARAQDERENVKRDQKRLMESLRKAEHKLEAERQDHEAEVHRLRKELKQTAGESSQGLAAELEALQKKLEQNRSDREDLEIKLGERSAQLEDIQAQMETLTRQLSQAQDSARQAEQQLLEATRAANEEMTIRLDAEQEIQAALRLELEKAARDRDGRQAELSSLTQQTVELRNALEVAQAGLADQQQAQQLVETLRQQLEQAERDRDSARQAEQNLQQETDQLRTEAEAGGRLAGAAPGDDAQQVLREELQQARSSAELAINERDEIQEQLRLAQSELEDLRAQLGEFYQDQPLSNEPAPMPSHDDDAIDVGSILGSSLEESSAAENALAAEEPVIVEAERGVSASADAVFGGKPRSGMGLMAGALLVVLSVAGAAWWFGWAPSSGGQADLQASGSGVQPMVGEQNEAGGTAVTGDESGEAVPRTSLPAFVRGAPDLVELGAQPSQAVAGSAAEEPTPSATTGEEPQQTDGDVADGDAVLAAAVRQPGAEFRDKLRGGGSGPSMVELYADSFQMGSGSASPNFDERPRHDVALQRFALSKYEVTFEQYDRFAESSGRARPRSGGSGRGSRPVVNVSWADAVAYTEWLSAQTGHRYRLPTEAEWEFAAHSGTITRYWWGNKVGQAHANCFDCGTESSGSETVPVGSFPASPFGLHDLAGNAREWVQDCYQPNYRNAPTDGSAVESANCAQRVIRGGSYASPSANLRVTARDQAEAGTRLDDLGFRVVREY